MVSSITSVVDDVQKKRKSVLQQINVALEKAEEKKSYNALLSVFPEEAREKARRLDARIANGESIGPLAGVPFVAKDNFITFDGITTAASDILSNFRSPVQATAVTKLEAAGAVCVGKANLDSFGHGGSTENSAFGPTKNAYDETRVAGGSSGGSAVAVALGIVPLALASDTGGSTRQPASFNNVFGYKPSYGMVSRFGLIAMISSSDCVGVITKTASDTELALEVIAGIDERDSVSLPDYFVPEPVNNKKRNIGIIKEYISEANDPDVVAKIEEVSAKLTEAGHQVSEVSIPAITYSLPMYYIIGPAEISSNLARYDGVRYGSRAKSSTLAELYNKTRDQGFVSESERRILIGSYVLSSGYYDAYYQQAQKARTLLINGYKQAFATYDALLSPVAPTPAFKIGKNTTDPLKMYLQDIMTVAPSLAGLPALSLPAGMSRDGLPIGVQLTGKYKSDSQLLALAKEMELKI